MKARLGRTSPSGNGRDGRVLTGSAGLCLAAFGVIAHAPPAQAAPFAPPPASAASSAPALTVEDPLEGFNRRGYAIHNFIDRTVLKPLALSYQRHAPGPVQKALHNLMVELSEPVVFGNDLLQLRINRAATTFTRFVTNATVGVGGLMDPATKFGLPHHNNGFGTTLGRYGIAPGPYLFIPMLGPSNFRDLLGQAMDFYSDPISHIHYDGRDYVTAGIWIIGGIDQRANAEADLEQIEQMGTDPYATLRSLFMQNRESEIHPGRGVNIENLPSFDDTPAAPAPAAPPAAEPSKPAPSPQASEAPAATDAASAAPSSALVDYTRTKASGDAFYFLPPPDPPSAPPAAEPSKPIPSPQASQAPAATDAASTMSSSALVDYTQAQASTDAYFLAPPAPPATASGGPPLEL
jgi:phospholipid-binding lipoprotein MlaA